MKIGDKIEIIEMQGEPNYSGRTGTVTHIDDMGTIHGTWGGLGLIPETDSYKIIKDTELERKYKKIGISLALIEAAIMAISIFYSLSK